MANVQQINNAPSSFTYYQQNNGNVHPSKINTEQFKARGFNRPLSQKPYIVNDDEQHSGNNSNNNKSNHPPPPRGSKSPPVLNRNHTKSRSHIGLSPTSLSATRSKSPVSRVNNSQSLAAMNVYSGTCPYCNTDAPLLDYITPANRHSHLTELRDKLSAVEALAGLLKQQISELQSDKTGKVQALEVEAGASSKKQVSNPFQEDASSKTTYHLDNLSVEQKQALSLLTMHKNVTFPLKGTAMNSPQESIGYFDKFKEMRRRFVNQDFFVSLDLVTRTFTVHSKMKSGGSKETAKQYRQVRSFASLNGAEFESAKDNVLKIWFKNTRGYFLVSFASETEANTVLSLINIIVNNEEYQRNISSQLVWASYVDKKGKRMRLLSQKFLCLIKLEVKLYKTHTNYRNGEEPSQMINLMDVDLIRDKKDIKFSKKKQLQDNDDDKDNEKAKSEVLLCIKLNSEIERDDFLNLCAQTLGKAIQKRATAANANANGALTAALAAGGSVAFGALSPSQTATSYIPAMAMNNNADSGSAFNLHDNEDSATDVEDSEFYMYNDGDDEKSEYHKGQSFNEENAYDEGLMIFKSMTMTLRGPPTDEGNWKNRSSKHATYLEKLNNTPRMYGASHHKALDRLAKKRPSDIDFIETTFNGNEIVLKSAKNEDLKTYQLLDVLGKSMISGAFLNKFLYLHKAVWEQNKVMVINYEKKLEVFGIMLSALDDLLKGINIDWLKSDFNRNSNPFHERLKKCEIKLRDAQAALTDFISKNEQKSKEKGAAKFLNKYIKDKGRVKVFDNQPYRDLIFKICGHASSVQLYYIYLSKPSKKHEDDRKILLNDLRGITLCMASFGRVVVGDIKEFLCAYLRRGAKNLYE